MQSITPQSCNTRPARQITKSSPAPFSLCSALRSSIPSGSAHAARERLQADCCVISIHDCSCAEAVLCLRRKLNEHNDLVARHESAYNKAQEDGRGMEGRLPQLKQQAAQLDKDAAQAAQQAQHHSDGEPSTFGHTTGDLSSPHFCSTSLADTCKVPAC